MQQPIQQPQQQTGQPQPIYSDYVYYTPPSGPRSLFSFKKTIYTVYPGWLIMTDEKTGVEVARIQLAPDLQVKTSMGQSRIKFLAGQKVKLTQVGYSFIFYNPLLMFLSYWFIFAKRKNATAFDQAVKAGAGVPPTM